MNQELEKDDEIFQERVFVKIPITRGSSVPDEGFFNDLFVQSDSFESQVKEVGYFKGFLNVFCEKE